MILIFLGDWRPTIIIGVSIPLSIFVSVILLSALGETINIMTLGGLALAVGILVDDATVEIENIERNPRHGQGDEAGNFGRRATGGRACLRLDTMYLHRVRADVFFGGRCQVSFVPLAEAVCFAMLASYLLSRTLVPTMVMFIMRGHEHIGRSSRPTSWQNISGSVEHGFERFRGRYQQLLETTLEHRGLFAIGFVTFCVLSLALVFFLGEDFFPQVDAGLIAGCTFVRGPVCAWKETARPCAMTVEKVSVAKFQLSELQTMLDNIRRPLFRASIFSYSSFGGDRDRRCGDTDVA